MKKPISSSKMGKGLSCPFELGDSGFSKDRATLSLSDQHGKNELTPVARLDFESYFVRGATERRTPSKEFLFVIEKFENTLRLIRG